MEIDITKARKLAPALYDRFRQGDIFGINIMPEDLLPAGIAAGSYEHLMYITLTVSIDYQRPAGILWHAASKTYQDASTNYLFSPDRACNTEMEKIVEDMGRYSLSKKPHKDAKIWKSLCKTFHQYWNNDPRNFIEECSWNSLNILARLKYDHDLRSGQIYDHFPYLRGDKIGPLWIRMLRDNLGLNQLTHLGKVPIPVDVHIARASLTLGVVRGSYSGKMVGLFNEIREAWFGGVSNHKIENRSMIAIDVDEPLWNLSKYGCSMKKPNGSCPKHSICPFREDCISGTIRIEKDYVEMST